MITISITKPVCSASMQAVALKQYGYVSAKPFPSSNVSRVPRASGWIREAALKVSPFALGGYMARSRKLQVALLSKSKAALAAGELAQAFNLLGSWRIERSAYLVFLDVQVSRAKAV